MRPYHVAILLLISISKFDKLFNSIYLFALLFKVDAIHRLLKIYALKICAWSDTWYRNFSASWGNEHKIFPFLCQAEISTAGRFFQLNFIFVFLNDKQTNIYRFCEFKGCLYLKNSVMSWKLFSDFTKNNRSIELFRIMLGSIKLSRLLNQIRKLAVVLLSS